MRLAAMSNASLFRAGMLRECWEFRDFILASVKRDFVSRYLGTQLGFFWAVAQPLAMIAIYTLVFANIMRPALPGHPSRFAYSIYLCAGILSWQLFSDLLNRSVGVFVRNANLLKKVNLPKLSLPIIVALSGLSNFAVVLVIFLAFLVAIGAFPVHAILALVPLLVLVVAFAVGLGVLLGTINVFYRDVEQSTAMLLQFWFWLTPIVYPGRSLPGFLGAALEWNPMWPIVGFAQSIFVEDRVPPWSTLVYPALVAIALLLLGLFAFRRLSGEIVDEL
ncbi:MAG TPA: ABC transporter permease [Casimicrobiaceae bacterium]|nr:ABC transporter permease [Casimicrobiaceae bacterium]